MRHVDEGFCGILKETNMRTVFLSLGKKVWDTSFLLFLFLTLAFFAFYASADEAENGQNFFQDTDQDGLSNEEEKAYGTDPNSTDTDNDGYSDGVEIESGYDPIKPAPGDRVVPDVTSIATVQGGADPSENVTLKTADAVANIVQDAASNPDPQGGVSMENLDVALQNALGGADEELVLPEIDTKDIKIKKVSKKLKGEKRKEQEKRDVLEYATVVAYIAASYSPIEIADEGEAEGAIRKISSGAMTSFQLGDFQYLDDLEKRAKSVSEQMKDVEVPEEMLDLHVRGLQLLTYASSLKGELKGNQVDPLKQVSNIGKTQALINELNGYLSDISSKYSELGIDNIPFGQ